jgi:hypothetical protein
MRLPGLGARARICVIFLSRSIERLFTSFPGRPLMRGATAVTGRATPRGGASPGPARFSGSGADSVMAVTRGEG